MPTVFKGILKAVPTRYPGYGIKLPFAFSGKVQNAIPNGRAVVTRASYEEDGESLVTVVAAAGDVIFNEVRIQNENETTDTLMQAWRDERLDAFLTDAALISNLSPEGFMRMLQKYEEVMGIWKPRPTTNFFAGTDFAGYPRVNFSRPVKPHLLSFLGSNSGPRDNIVMKRRIAVEVKTTTGWTVADELDRLCVLDNGIMEIPNLRLFPLVENSEGTQKPGCWRWTTTEFATSGGKLDITLQPIRLSVAMPADARLTTSVALANHAIGGSDFSGVLYDMPDADRIAKRFRRVHYVDLGNLYQLWLRNGSYPLAESLGGSAEVNATVATALRNDLPQLQSHARRILYELGRLAKRGRLIFDGQVVSSLQPGTPIESLTPLGPINGVVPDFPIRAVVDSVAKFHDPKTNQIRTEVYLR